MVSSQIIQRVLLEAIAEADLNRRDFLKRTGAGMVATLLSGGVPPTVVAKAVSGNALTAVINLNVNWDMNRGEWSDLGESARNLSNLFAFLKRSNIPVMSDVSGFDEYVYHIQLNPDTLQKLTGVVDWGQSENASDPLLHLPKSFGGGEFEIYDITDQNLNWNDQVDHPVLDFWNKFAKFDGFNAHKNAGFVKRLTQTFGDKVDKPQILTVHGDQIELTWDQFDDLVQNPENYLQDEEYVDPNNDFNDEDWEEEDEDWDEDEEAGEAELEPDDKYDEYLKSQWSTEGGFTESIHTLYRKIGNGSITLREALNWVNDLHWPKEDQQRLAVKYIERTLSE